MTSETVLRTISDAELTNLEEFVGEFLKARAEVTVPPSEITNLAKQYKYLEFVFQWLPDGVKTYLEKEPQHFARLAGAATEEGMAIYVHDIGYKIFSYSVLGDFLIKLAFEMDESETSKAAYDFHCKHFHSSSEGKSS